MLKKTQVIMLPTNQKAKESQIILVPTNPRETQCLIIKSLFNGVAEKSINEGLSIPQHLYFLSDKEIKEGDWFINIIQNEIYKHDLKGYTIKKYHKKIIATTDESLKFLTNTEEDYDPENGGLNYQILSQPSQSFIQKYVDSYNKGNVITEVMVEYIFNEDDSDLPNKGLQVQEFLKVNPKDNTITIKPVKNSWTREEVIALHKANCERLTNSYVSDDINWIEENL